MNRLLVVGPSVRWLMQSARRAGLPVVGIDFFADVDALQLGTVVRVAQWAEVPAAAASLRPQATLLGGGFETQREVVEKLRQQGPLWNLAAGQCAVLRDPAQWCASLADAGLHVPQYRRGGDGQRKGDLSKSWMLKHQSKAGGAAVRQLSQAEVAEWFVSGDCGSAEEYLQERQSGVPSSALFFLGPNGACCLGYFRQLCGWSEFGARGYQYCGGIGPLPISVAQRTQLDALGKALSVLGGRGVIGVDLLAEDEVLCPIEINPRPTASGELWELAEEGASLIGLQAAAFAEGAGWPARILEPTHQAKAVDNWKRNLSQCRTIFGKAILFWSGREPLEIDEQRTEFLREGAAAGWVADIPHQGSVIETGAPVVTVYASGATEAEVGEALIRRVTDVRARLAT